jgi:hypothetical protein
MVNTQAIIDIVNNMSIENAGCEVVQPINQTSETPVQEESVDVGPENIQSKDEVQEVQPEEENEPTEEQSTETDIVNIPAVQRSTRSTVEMYLL